MTLRVGRLRPDTYELNLHDSPNGKIVGQMYRGDRFELDDMPPRRNPGGEKDWVRGRVNFTSDRVWVALERLTVDVLPDVPPPTPEPPWESKFPPDTPPSPPKPRPKLVRPSLWDIFLSLIAATIIVAILWMVVTAFTPASAQSCWACMHGCTDQERLCKCFNKCGEAPSVMDIPASLRALADRESEKHRADTLNAAAEALDQCGAR